MRSKKTIPKILRAIFEIGTSEIKAVYQVDNDLAVPLCMGSEVFKLDRAVVEQAAAASAADCHPSFNAWYVDTFRAAATSQAVVVGELARRLKVPSSIRLMKREILTCKVKAIVGAIARYLELTSLFVLEPILVLPAEEHFAIQATKQQKQGLIDELTQALRDYYFQGKFKVRCRVGEIRFMPEGAGAIVLSEANNGPIPSSKHLLSFDGGHRNLNLLSRHDGGWQGWTNDWGFHQLLDAVLERVAIPAGTENLLLRAIWEMGSQLNPNHPQLQNLTSMMTPDRDRAQQIRSDLIEAIGVARRYYWQSVEGWLRQVCPPACARVVVSGGSGYYLKEELRAFFGDIPLDLGEKDFARIEAFLKRDARDSTPIESVRFLNTYGLMQAFFSREMSHVS